MGFHVLKQLRGRCALQIPRPHHANLSESRLLTMQTPNRHRTKMPSPTPSSVYCMISSMPIRERSSLLNISAVASSTEAVLGGEKREGYVMMVRE